MKEKRGTPPLAIILQDLKDLEDYRNAERRGVDIKKALAKLLKSIKNKKTSDKA